jgi:hypothetical protein
MVLENINDAIENQMKDDVDLLEREIKRKKINELTLKDVSLYREHLVHQD